MANIKTNLPLINGISLNFEMDAATEVFHSAADYIIVKDSLSTHGNKTGEIIHKSNNLEIIVGIPREKISRLPADIFRPDSMPMSSFMKRGKIRNELKSSEVNMVVHDRGFSSNILRDLLEMAFLANSFTYYLVEAESFLAYSTLQSNSSLIWHEKNRSIEKKQGPGFNGQPVLVSLDRVLMPSNQPRADGDIGWAFPKKSNAHEYKNERFDVFEQSSLANGKYYGGLQTTLLLPGIIFYEREEGLIASLREKVWKEFIIQFVKEINAAPKEERQKFSTINVFDTRNRLGWKPRGVDYVHQKTGEVMAAYLFGKELE